LKLQWEINKKKKKFTLVINPNFISTLRIVSMTVFSFVMYVLRNIRDYKNRAGVTLYSECCDVVTYLSINNHLFLQLPIFNAWFYAGFSFIFCRTDETYQEFDSTHSLRVLIYIFIKGKFFNSQIKQKLIFNW